MEALGYHKATQFLNYEHKRIFYQKHKINFLKNHLCMWIFCLYVCVLCFICVLSAQRPDRGLNPLELELQTVVSYNVHVGDQTLVI